MRGKMNDEDEAAILHCNMSQFRQAAEKKINLIPAIFDSISPVQILLMGSYMEKGFKFSLQLVRMRWSSLESVDSSLEYGEKYRKVDLESHKPLLDFMSRCCQFQHYSFSIKKCGQSSCSVCKPVCMPIELFDQLH